ncbi:hypothetical protein CP533_4870 [Ophiocordyceps camponoti-saundersi (nom. inval.)]|nr:hypothetical protein CP533_4870 [Ophiocordyceps camponoti-saundersi (nom. inval.)]
MQLINNTMLFYTTLLPLLLNLTSAMPSSSPQRRWDWGTTKRTARVTIKNNSPGDIKSVSLVHKYSDVYNNRAEWPVIKRFTSPDYHHHAIVDFNTGPLTTGRDWWLLSFYTDDMSTNYFTNPNNFRNVFDFLESVGPTVTISIAGATAGILGALAGPATSVIASTAAAAVAKATTDGLFNAESTVGFKQHILRTEDADRITTIVINRDYSVTFYSHSETPSYTVTSSRPAEIQVKDESGQVVDESRKG